MRTKMKLLGLVVAALGALAFGLQSTSDRDGTILGIPAGSASSSAPAAEGTYHPAAGGELDELLDQVEVVRSRPEVPGYDRDCGAGHSCSFGPAWTDDVDVAGGHNGCGTRDDILARDLTDVRHRPGTHNCVVIAGELADPYTGTRIEFRKENALEVGIDHVIPLARAWDLGASRWPEERRRDFANDPLNLLAVSGPANSSKADQGPGEWLPLNAAFRCEYLARYLSVTVAYDLPITQADHDAITELEPHCSPNLRESTS